MRVDLSPSLVEAGASNEPAGTHTSRTMMFDELDALLYGCAPDASYDAYATAIVDDNILGKRTLATREKSLRHLRELYALRGSVPVFGAMRLLWQDDPSARPLLALMCAAARDPLVRCAAELVHDTAPGQQLESEDFAAAVQAAFPDRFSPGVRARIGRNLASTWTQSGHLAAASKASPKVRARVTPSQATVTYALYLGHLDGQAGPTLLEGTWADLLDADAGAMRGLAEAAARRGWVEFAAAGGMLQIGFTHLDDVVRGGAA